MMFVLLIATTIFVVFIVQIYKKSWQINRALKDIPGPKGIPFIGNALQLRDTDRMLYQLHDYINEFGRLIRMQVGPDVIVVAADSKFLEIVMSSTKVLKKASEYNNFLNWLGTGLLTSTGKKWHQRRKAITPTFHYNILEQFVETFNCNSDILIEKLEEHLEDDSVDLYPIVTLYTLDVICETAMGISVNAQKEKHKSDYVNAVKSISKLVITRSFSPIKRFDTLYKYTNDYVLEKNYLKILHGTTESVIQKRRQLLLNNNSNENKKEDETFGIKKKVAFLDMLLQCEINGKKLTDTDIREEVATFMFEGHDTTSSAISFCLLSISQNPEIQKKLYEEMYSIFDTDKTKPATYEELQNMKYLELVIKETLRLYPSVPAYGRELTTDITYDGKVFPAGLILYLFAFAVHRDPKLYSEPEKFIPERFLEVKTDKTGFSYIPFSAGPRNCIGQKFAMLEIKSAVSKVIRNFELLPIEGFAPIFLFESILKSKNGMQIKLKRRR